MTNYIVLADELNLKLADKLVNLNYVRHWCERVRHATGGELVIEVGPDGQRLSVGGSIMRLCEHKIQMTLGEAYLTADGIVIDGQFQEYDVKRASCMFANTMKIDIEWRRHPMAGYDLRAMRSNMARMRDSLINFEKPVNEMYQVQHGWAMFAFVVSFDSELKVARL